MKQKVSEEVRKALQTSKVNIAILSKDYFDKDVMKLSASEKAKVAIASSLVLNPEVLILDDITTTGTIMNACGDILLNNNIEKNKIYKLAIAATAWDYNE